MAKLLSDKKHAVKGRLVAVDNSALVGPMFTLRIPAGTGDVRRPGSYVDFVLLDVNRKTLQKRITIDDKLLVIIHVAAGNVEKGTRNELTFQIDSRANCQRVSHCRRVFDALGPINGKVIENDARGIIVVDAGVSVVASLLQHTPSRTRQIKLNSWVTLWPSPPSHGIILGTT